MIMVRCDMMHLIIMRDIDHTHCLWISVTLQSTPVNLSLKNKKESIYHLLESGHIWFINQMICVVMCMLRLFSV